MTLRHLLVCALCIILSLASPVSYYVDGTNGNDANPGTQSQPFKTIGKAQEAIRGLSPLPGGGVTVNIRQGEYSFLDNPLHFSSRDSGTANSMITYTAYAGERVRLSAGLKLPNSQFTSIQKVTSDVISKEGVEAGMVQINLRNLGVTNYGNLMSRGLGTCSNDKLELFFNHQPMILARYPNINSNGTWMWDLTGKVSGNTFQYSGNRPQRWVNEQDPWMHGYWSFDWADNYVKISKIDTGASTITIDSSTPPLYTLDSNARYYGVNLLSELDTPMEYYLDRRAGMLYFIPPRPIQPTDEIHVSIGEGVITMSGTSYITLKDLTIDMARSTAIAIEGNYMQVVNCTISNNGDSSLSFSGSYSSFSSITSTGNGCSVLSIGGGDQKSLTPGNNMVRGCELSFYARWKRAYTPGIYWYGVGNQYYNNHVHDGPHVGILGGGNDCTFDGNTLSNLCYEVLDSGAFYTGRSWAQRGNVVRNGLFENIQILENPQLGSRSVQGIYLDDQMSGYQIYNNTFRNCFVGTFVGGGRRNHIYNNHYYNCTSTAVHLDARGLDWQKADCSAGGQFEQELESLNYQHPPWSTHYPELVNIMQDHPCTPVYNVFEDNTYCDCPKFIDIDDQEAQAWLDTVRNNVQRC